MHIVLKFLVVASELDGLKQQNRKRENRGISLLMNDEAKWAVYIRLLSVIY